MGLKKILKWIGIFLLLSLILGFFAGEEVSEENAVNASESSAGPLSLYTLSPKTVLENAIDDMPTEWQFDRKPEPLNESNITGLVEAYYASFVKPDAPDEITYVYVYRFNDTEHARAYFESFVEKIREERGYTDYTHALPKEKDEDNCFGYYRRYTSGIYTVTISEGMCYRKNFVMRIKLQAFWFSKFSPDVAEAVYRNIR